MALLKEKYPKDPIVLDILWDIPTLPKLITRELSLKLSTEKTENAQESSQNSQINQSRDNSVNNGETKEENKFNSTKPK